MKRIIPIIVIILLLLPHLVTAFTYTQNLPSNTIYFDDFGNYTTPVPCTTASLACLPGWGAYDNATGGIANITTWHPLASSGKSLLMQSGNFAGAKFDRHRSWAITSGITKVSISQWFQFDQAFHTAGTNSAPSEIHFSLEMVGSDQKFHECVLEIFSPGATTQFDDFIGIKDQAFNYNMTLRAFDTGGFNNNPNTLFDNYQWHYEKITMDISNTASPTCPYMQLDNLVISSLPNNSGWTGTPSNPASYPIASTAITNTQYNDVNGYKYTRPFRLEIAMITNSGSIYKSWHTNILITDDSPGNPSIIQFSINSAALIFLTFIGVIGILYYLRIGDRLMFGKGTGLFRSRSVIKYKEERATTAEQEAKRAIKVIAIILVIGAILTAFGLYFAGFI